MCPYHTWHGSSFFTDRHKHLGNQDALLISLKHPKGICKGMVTRLWIVHFSSSGFHVVLNPVKITIHICINARYVFAATTYSPADDSNQMHSIILHADQRPSRVTLQRSTRLVKNHLFCLCFVLFFSLTAFNCALDIISCVFLNIPFNILTNQETPCF